MLVEEKMKTNNYLITVTSDDIKELKVKGVNFLFPIKGLVVGIKKTYEIHEIIEENAFILINRILDKDAINKLREDLKKMSSNIIGICFNDLGVLQVIKELNLSLKLIYIQNHNTTNYKSINYYLDYVDSVLISTDITKDEIIKILDNSSKPLVIPFFMFVDIMYSRRKLLSNFQEEFSLEKNSKIVLKESISKNIFKGIENEYGTVLFDNNYIDYRNIEHENILYRYINPVDLTKDEVEKIINNEDIDVAVGDGFLNRKTYYRLKEEK